MSPQVAQRSTKLGRVHAYLGPSASPADVRSILAVCGSVTLSGTGGLRAARDLARTGHLDGVDLDPATYLQNPKRSILTAEAIPGMPELNWVAAQEDLGLSVIRTAGTRVRAGDLTTLTDQLSAPTRPGLSVVLALDASWLKGKHLAVLTATLRAAARDISLAFAALFDPLDSVGHIDGLRSILRWGREQGISVELLRGDLNAIAAVTEGATLGAVGLTTLTRHVPVPFPAGTQRQKLQRDTTPHVLVPSLMHWYRAERLGALRPWGGAGITTCDCAACANDPDGLLRFDAPRPTVEAATAADAREHDLHSWTRLASEILSASDPLSALRDARHAASLVSANISATYKVAMDAPPWLSAWD